jgi:carbamoyltransferase
VGIADTGKKHFSNSLSCGGLFNVISGMVGFNGTSAGKTMGLAAYGRAENIDDSWFSQCEDSGIWVADIREISKLFRRRFQTPEDLTLLLNPTVKMFLPEETKADLAKKCQIETLEHTARLIDRYTKLTGERNVVLSGGYFLNCSNNYEYIKRFPDLNFFVDPVAHDGGTTIGAAKYLWHKLTGDNTLRKLETLYLG